MSARKIVLLAVAGAAVGVVTLVALGFALKALALDDILSNEYVPTTEQIVARIHLRPFLVNASEIEGIYGNMDVDAVIFRYRTGERDLEAFLARVEEHRQGTQWTPLAPHGEFRRFQRVFPKGSRMFCSVEEVRLKHAPDGTVLVGWVQADSSRDVHSLEECSESRFANSVVWPRLEEL
jgi:hypothetical protein